MKSILFAIVALATLSTAAMAADAVVSQSPAPGTRLATSFDWTGAYIGATAGYGWHENHYTYTPLNGSTDFDVNGFVGGLTAGYNWQRGPLVFGIEGDISYADIKGSAHEPPGGVPCHVEGCTANVNWFGTGRGRLGYAFDNFLPYVTGGFAVGHVKGTADLGACGGFATCSYGDTRWGWTAGAGMEWAMNRHLSFKAEYLHVDLGTPDFTTVLTTTKSVAFDTVRVGVNYKF